MEVRKNMKKKIICIFMCMLLIIIAMFSVTGNTNTNTFTWSIETVDSIDEVGRYCSITLDTDNNPHISYLGGGLKYAYFDGSWHNEIAYDPNFGGVGSFSSIELDSNNNPHMVCFRIPVMDLEYVYYDGSWHNETVDSDGHVGIYCSLARDTNDNLHISYCHHDGTNYSLKYAKFDGSWQIETVDNMGSVGQYSSISLDASNNPHISYYDTLNNNLKYAYFDGSWHNETVDDAGDVNQVGAYCSIAIDSDDNPHISYMCHMSTGWPNDDLKYAYLDGSWQIETVDSAGNDNVGAYTSIAMDSCDNTHISYYDETNGNLKHAYYNGSWQYETVDSTDDVGQYTSIILDTNNNVHISYYDVTNKDLKYAYGENNLIPDLYCDGSLKWTDIKPSSTVTGSFNVLNIDKSGSFLNWKVDTYPNWMQPIPPAKTPFSPDNGTCLTFEDGAIKVDVEFEAPPDKNKDLDGFIKIVNLDDPNDFCEIEVILSTPRGKFLHSTLFIRLFERFQNLFPILRYIQSLQ